MGYLLDFLLFFVGAPNPCGFQIQLYNIGGVLGGRIIGGGVGARFLFNDNIVMARMREGIAN